MILLTLAIMCGLFWVGFEITGALLSACVWLFIRLPCAIILWTLGICLCCTVLLIPIGVKFFGWGARVLFG